MSRLKEGISCLQTWGRGGHQWLICLSFSPTTPYCSGPLCTDSTSPVCFLFQHSPSPLPCLLSTRWASLSPSPHAFFVLTKERHLPSFLCVSLVLDSCQDCNSHDANSSDHRSIVSMAVSSRLGHFWRQRTYFCPQCLGDAHRVYQRGEIESKRERERWTRLTLLSFLSDGVLITFPFS